MDLRQTIFANGVHNTLNCKFWHCAEVAEAQAREQNTFTTPC